MEVISIFGEKKSTMTQTMTVVRHQLSSKLSCMKSVLEVDMPDGLSIWTAQCVNTPLQNITSSAPIVTQFSGIALVSNINTLELLLITY